MIDAPCTVSEGARAVGELCELTTPEQLVVLWMRRWVESEGGRRDVQRDAALRFGEHGGLAVDALARFLGAVACHARRPLQRHGRGCACVGADEGALAAIVAAAGRRDGCLLRLIVPPLVAGEGFTAVVAAGLALSDALEPPAPATLH